MARRPDRAGWLTGLLALGLAVVLAIPGSASPAGTDVEAAKPDFSAVTSPQRIGALVRKGALVRVHLFPVALGGQDVRQNMAYVTPEAAAALELVTGTLKRFTAEGLIDKLDVQPEYRGDSLIPIRIVMHASHREKPGGFHPTVEVW